MTQPVELTVLFQRWIEDSDEEAFQLAVGRIHKQLKRVAHTRRRNFPKITIQTTELLGEAFLKIIPVRDKLFLESHWHFINLFSKAVHRFLLEELRRRRSLKHGAPVPLDNPDALTDDRLERNLENELTILKALEEVSREDSTLYEVVYCRHFLGMTIAETAEVLKIPTITVNRKWKFAKAWLFDLISN
jgi:RNA polymerase sigma factor (TIGR02999 family)